MNDSTNLIGGTQLAGQNRMKAMMDAASDQSRPPLSNGALAHTDPYKAAEQAALNGDRAAQAAILDGSIKPRGMP